MCFPSCDPVSVELSVLNKSPGIAQRSGDSLVWSAPAGNPPDLLVINGEHMPEIAATPGRWQRWRVIFAGWRNVGRSALNFAVDGCTMQLLAKDEMRGALHALPARHVVVSFLD